MFLFNKVSAFCILSFISDVLGAGSEHLRIEIRIGCETNVVSFPVSLTFGWSVSFLTTKHVDERASLCKDCLCLLQGCTLNFYQVYVKVLYVCRFISSWFYVNNLLLSAHDKQLTLLVGSPP